MISEILDYLNNYFIGQKVFGKFKIENGIIDTDTIAKGRYFAIRGSVFNDGVYQYPTTDLHDEEFDGAIWLLNIPLDLINIAKDMKDWQDKNGIDSPAMGPYQSESFGGYSYTKGTGSVYSNSVFDAYKGRLSRWKKVASVEPFGTSI